MNILNIMYISMVLVYGNEVNIYRYSYLDLVQY